MTEAQQVEHNPQNQQIEHNYQPRCTDVIHGRCHRHRHFVENGHQRDEEKDEGNNHQGHNDGLAPERERKQLPRAPTDIGLSGAGEEEE